MAYKALQSVLKILDSVLDHQNTNSFSHSKNKRRRPCSSNGEIRCRNCSILLDKLEIQSMHENVVFLSHFLEGFPREAAGLEARLTNAAEQGRIAFNGYALHSPYIAPDENDLKLKVLRQELENSIKEIESIYQEAQGIKNSNRNRCLLPRVAPMGKETTVGLEEGLTEIKGRLYGEPSHLGIIPIIGMGGIGKTTLARVLSNCKEVLSHHYFVMFHKCC